MSGVRLQLGELTTLGLELLVVADIMETLTKLETEEYSWDALGKIGGCRHILIMFFICKHLV